MTWRDGLFLHWPVDPDDVRPHVPEELTLETYDGRAWLSVLPFVLTKAGLRGAPPIARIAFAELNVRTYVRCRGDPGLFFFSIDIGNPAVAALTGRGTRLPVHYAQMHVSGGEDRVSFASTRDGATPAVGAPTGDDPPARFAATYRPAGPAFTADEGTLEYWLTERRRFYASSGGRVLSAEIAHDRWPIRSAEVTIRENTMFEANGLPQPAGDPIAYFCGDLSMTGSIPRRLRERRS